MQGREPIHEIIFVQTDAGLSTYMLFAWSLEWGVQPRCQEKFRTSSQVLTRRNIGRVTGYVIDVKHHLYMQCGAYSELGHVSPRRIMPN